MKRFLLWSFDRGSIQYDVICALILAFIFLTPSTSINDRPLYMRVWADDPEVKMSYENGIDVYTVKLESASFWNDAAHQTIALLSLEKFLKVPVTPVKIKPVYTTRGMTIAYAIWIEEVK
jgi:hypothetical protein